MVEQTSESSNSTPLLTCIYCEKLDDGTSDRAHTFPEAVVAEVDEPSTGDARPRHAGSLQPSAVDRPPTNEPLGRRGHPLDDRTRLPTRRQARNHARARWRDRAHFFALAPVAMRRGLVDQAKACLTRKRMPLLPRLCEDGTPEALGVPSRTVPRDWAKARMPLHRALAS
jgi:hypothetical protein